MDDRAKGPDTVERMFGNSKMNKRRLWETIEKTLREDILTGRYRPGEKLPTELDLAERFGVTRSTLRRALSALSAEGLLRSQRGSGIFVQPRPLSVPLSAGIDLAALRRQYGADIHRKTVSLSRRPARPTEAQALECANESILCAFESLLLHEGNTFAFCRDMVITSRLAGVCDRLPGNFSLENILRDAGVVSPRLRVRRVTVVPGMPEVTAALCLSPMSMVMHATSIIEDIDGVAVAICEFWAEPGRVCLSYEPKRVPESAT